MGTSSRVIILNGIGNITEQQLRFYLQLDTLKSNLDHLFILLNVGKDGKGETFVADCNRNGNHWAILDIDLKSKRYLYCDTLAWPVPRYLNNDLMPVLTALESVCSQSVPKPGMRNPNLIRCAHLSESIDEFGKHHCRGRCLVNLPLQRCSNICGIISVFTAAIAVVYPRIWTTLKETQQEIKYPALWFRSPSDHPEYIRKCLGQVLVDGKFREGCLGILPEAVESIENEFNLLKDSSHRKRHATETEMPFSRIELNEEGVGILRARGTLRKVLSRKHSYTSQEEKSLENSERSKMTRNSEKSKTDSEKENANGNYVRNGRKREAKKHKDIDSEVDGQKEERRGTSSGRKSQKQEKSIYLSERKDKRWGNDLQDMSERDDGRRSEGGDLIGRDNDAKWYEGGDISEREDERRNEGGDLMGRDNDAKWYEGGDFSERDDEKRTNGGDLIGRDNDVKWYEGGDISERDDERRNEGGDLIGRDNDAKWYEGGDFSERDDERRTNGGDLIGRDNDVKWYEGGDTSERDDERRNEGGDLIGRNNDARRDEGDDIEEGGGEKRKKAGGLKGRGNGRRNKGNDNDKNGFKDERRGDSEEHPESEVTIRDNGGIRSHDDQTLGGYNQSKVKQVN
eukprot:Seg3879.3 transcript_id=Seg3879.3/GoldUCD/mRNA.D3Y31 product=Titin protein_id=Seg3879.3/GoldUCD/D3Y31